MAHTNYESPLSTRYASERMQYLFSAQNRIATWRKLWCILAECEMALGLPIAAAQIDEMRASVDDIDFDMANTYEKKFRHDVMAHVHTYGEKCPTAKPIIHLGATSCYVTDNTDAMIMRDALHMLQGKLTHILRMLASFAETYKTLPTLAYTHFQPAQPTTVGKRCTLWMLDIMQDIAEIQNMIDTIKPLGCKGTTGTQASFLALFGDDYEKVLQLDHMIAEKMGFDAPVAVSGQTYSRKVDSRIANVLSSIAQSAHKFSNDLRLLAHLKEIEEPFSQTQIGSSAMAYKRNPMRAERMASLSRMVIASVQVASQTAAEQWLERTLDDSASKRIALTEAFLLTDAVLDLYASIASGFIVYPKVIEKHLQAEIAFMATENILMDAVKRGGDRQYLHERIRVHAMEASYAIKAEGKEPDLLSRIASDTAFQMSADELEQSLDLKAFIGCAAMQTEHFLKNEVAACLAQYASVEIQTAEIQI